MGLLRVILLLLAAATAGGQYLQERYRLSVVSRLPAAEALAFYEARRRRSRRVLLLTSIGAGLLGAVALGDIVLSSFR